MNFIYLAIQLKQAFVWVWAKHWKSRVNILKLRQIQFEWKKNHRLEWREFLLILLSHIHMSSLCVALVKAIESLGVGEWERVRTGSSFVFLSSQLEWKTRKRNLFSFLLFHFSSTFLRCPNTHSSHFTCTQRSRQPVSVCWAVLKSSLCYCTKCDFQSTRLSKCSMKFNAHCCCRFCFATALYDRIA